VGLSSYFNLFGQFPEEREEIVSFVLAVSFENSLFVEHDDFRSLFILIDDSQFIRDIIGGEIEFQRLETTDIPISFEEVRTVFFDNSPIKKLQNFFFGVAMIGIFDKKDVFLEIF